MLGIDVMEHKQRRGWSKRGDGNSAHNPTKEQTMQPTQPAMVIEEFKATARNSLVGWCRVRAPSGMVLHGVGVFASDGRAWVTAPSKPKIGRDGAPMRSADGKPLYIPAVSFATKDAYLRFSFAVIEALRLAHPDALPPADNGDLMPPLIPDR